MNGHDKIMDDIFDLSNSKKPKSDQQDGFYVDDTFNEVFLNSEYDKSTFIGKFIHLWKWRLYLRSYKKAKLTLADIPKLPTSDESEKQYNILEK